MRFADAAPSDLPGVDLLRDSWDSLTIQARRLVFLAAIESLVILPAVIGVKSVDVGRTHQPGADEVAEAEARTHLRGTDDKSSLIASIR